MKEFSTEIESKLELYLTKSSDFYEKGNTIQAGECLIKAYEFIPEPKEEYNESYNYCTYVLDYILDENYNLDIVWEHVYTYGVYIIQDICDIYLRIDIWNYQHERMC